MKRQNTGSVPAGGETRIVVDTGRRGIRSRIAQIIMAVTALIALVLVASAIHLLPQLRNPFSESTTDRSQPVILQRIVELHRYEAASGSFSVVVDVQKSSFLPSFLQGSDTVFIGVGNDNAYVDFSKLGANAVTVSADRRSATIKLPHSTIETATLDEKESYVWGQQKGLIDSFTGLFGGDPNGEQQLRVLAVDKISAAAKQSTLAADAERNTQTMLEGLLHALGFTDVTVTFG